MINLLEIVPVWQGMAIQWFPIQGGLTNLNYRVEADGISYFCRQARDIECLGVYRSNERICHERAAKLGIAPKIIYSGKDVLVTEYVTGLTLEQDSLQDKYNIKMIAETARAFHNAEAYATGEYIYFSPFMSARTYIQRCSELGIKSPLDLNFLFRQLSEWEKEITRYRLSFVHSDYKYNNLILDKDGKLWVVDWEYAGIGNYPLFDIAFLSGSVDMSSELDEILLASYFNGVVGSKARTDFKKLKAVSFVREAFWGLIQCATAGGFADHETYVKENFDKYLSLEI